MYRIVALALLLGMALGTVPLPVAAAADAAVDLAPRPRPELPIIPRDAPYRYSLPGLTKPATITVDRWGVPHIEAQTHYDAFFVQGFNAARDRLWQIDLWRRRGLGTLSTVFGRDYLDQDRAARLFLYRGDMYREWLAYGSDAKRIATAFTAGINAYIRLTEADPDLLAPEFGLLGYRPERWDPSDVVRIRSHGLWRNLTTEVRRARLWCTLGEDASRVRKVLEPRWRTRLPAGLDPCVIPADVLDTYRLAKQPVVLPSQASSTAQIRAKRLTPAERDRLDDAEAATLGSNNWAVAPQRTATGRAILADDPHRGHAIPSLRYIAHLRAPGLDVIGAGEPALPGLSIGHNERIAFGLTIFPIDQEDLYVYVKQRGGYFYNGEAEALRLVEETLTLPDGETETLQLRFTRHGPVIHETDKFVFAARAAWLEPGMAPYFGSVEYMRAQNWRTFVAALNRWGAPSENQVYADIDGNIGFKPAGLFPKRAGWDGLLPVPGDGRYEWQGFYDMDVLPEEYNPERGYVSSANALNLPGDYPIDRYPVGFEWSAPWRHRRIVDVLAEQPKHSLNDSLALQRDYQSLLAARIVAALNTQTRATPTGSDSPDDPTPATQARALLSAWDGVLSADSAAGALFRVWLRNHLDPAVATWLVGPEQAAELQPLDRYTLLSFLEQDAAPTLIEETLASAWEDLRARLGDDPANWRWGTLHQIRFQHPLLTAGLAADTGQAFALPPYPRGGSGNTANATTARGEGFDVTNGASFRMVLDVGNWDAARMTNAPGQSGDPRSPFYGDLLEGWATEGHFPLLYSKEAVEKDAVLRIELTPAPETALDGGAPAAR
ncbi:MAG: penicillin acylase family protein [Pseudomonadota bacterium]